MYGRNLGMPLLALSSSHCQFPLWPHEDRPKPEEMLFCAQARAGNSSYCPSHHKLCRSVPKGFAKPQNNS